MNILYLSSVRIPSEKASGLAIVRQCQAFAVLGHAVRLFVPKRERRASTTIKDIYGITPAFAVTTIQSFTLYKLGKPGLYTMLAYESLRAFFHFLWNVRTYEVVYARDQKILIPFILFGFSKRCFLELHTKHADLITKMIVKRVRGVIVISRGLSECYKQLTGRDDFLLEPSGVDVWQFNKQSSTQEAKRLLGLPYATVFGYVGKYKTMGAEKGVSDIIKAFSAVHAARQDTHLLLVGIEQSEAKEVEEMLRSVQLPDTAFTIMELDQKQFAQYVKACDVLLMNYPDTEHYASFMSPTKLFAYMAAGKPMVSSDLPSVREIESRGVKYVKPGDQSDLERGMLEVLDDYTTWHKAAEENRRLVERYTWVQRAGRIVNFM